MTPSRSNLCLHAWKLVGISYAAWAIADKALGDA